MTFQARRYPKSRISIRLTNENYDFLYLLSVRWDTSIAKALNMVVENSKSGIISCKPLTERTQ